MKKTKRKLPRDPAQLAKAVFDQAVGDAPPEPESPPKNPHAQALGRLGGSKGGKKRAENLTKEQRIEAARKAANSRWGNR